MRLALLACAVWLFAAPAYADRITLTYDGRILGFAPIGEASLDDVYARYFEGVKNAA